MRSPSLRRKTTCEKHDLVQSGKSSLTSWPDIKLIPQTNKLTKHTRTHIGEKPHVDPQCNRGCSTASRLKEHMYTHTGEKLYVCPICDKRFSQSSGLSRHSPMHRGEKPHVCSYCQKGFSRAKTLKNHIHTIRA